MPKKKDKGKVDPNNKSRRKLRIESGVEVTLPPILFGEYLTGYLYDMGPTIVNGMGRDIISYPVIESWENVTGIKLQPWEASWIRRLSSEYLSELQEAEDPSAPPPWQPEQTAEKRTQFTSRLKNILRG